MIVLALSSPVTNPVEARTQFVFFLIETFDTGTKLATQGGLVISAPCKRQGGDPPIWSNGDPQSSKYTRGTVVSTTLC